MSSAKAALESDTRTLAFEAGRRYGLRVNTISAGPLASRAASAIGKMDRMVGNCAANPRLPGPPPARDAGPPAAFLASPLGSGITGATIYVDKGYHAMGAAVATGGLLYQREGGPGSGPSLEPKGTVLRPPRPFQSWQTARPDYPPLSGLPDHPPRSTHG